MAKSFDEQDYPVTIKVLLSFHFMGVIEHEVDEIKGLNAGHAMYLAKLNWPSALSITIIE